MTACLSRPTAPIPTHSAIGPSATPSQNDDEPRCKDAGPALPRVTTRGATRSHGHETAPFARTAVSMEARPRSSFPRRCQHPRNGRRMPPRGEPLAKIERPRGHHTITPSFAVSNAAGVIEFVKKAFGGSVVDLYEG